MNVNLQMALRMAQACEATYFIGSAGGPASCPSYADVHFLSAPKTVISGLFDAALVGVTTTEIIVAFRGTLPINTTDWDAFIQSLLDWGNNTEARLVDVAYAVGRVHHGFAQSLDRLWDGVISAVRTLRSEINLPVLVVGHSKGGALATLGSLRMLHEVPVTPIEVYTYGSPRVGNTEFAKDHNLKIQDHWRFECKDDLVPHVPPTAPMLSFLGQVDQRLRCLSAHGYFHDGRLEFLDWDGTLVEGGSVLLDGQRLIHFGQLAAANNVKRVALDHSVAASYIPALRALTP